MVALSEVLVSDKARIDSSYFGKAAVALAARIAELPHARLGELATTFRKGIFDIKADTYVESGGFPFVRVGDLRSGLLELESLARISTEAHLLESKTRLVRNDIILSKTAYPAAALVTLPECNVSQDTIAVHLSDEAKTRFRPAYVVAYLNSGAGRALMGRLFQGNVQQHLGLSEAADLLIPAFSSKLQLTIERLSIGADGSRNAAKAAITEAEADLLDALGLGDWSPPEPLTYTCPVATVVEAGRLDAAYFAPKYEEIAERLRATGQSLAIGDDEGAFVARGSQPDYSECGLPVVNSRHVRTNRVLLDAGNRQAAPGRVRIRRGDVLINGTGVGTIGRVAPYLHEQDAVPDNHVTVVRLAGIDPIFLSVFLNSPLGQQQIERMISGSSGQIELYPADIRRILIWRAPDEVQWRIAARVEEAFSLESKSARLLAAAKRGVEIAITDDEASAMEFLAEQENVDADPA